jgi:hypothetical protein
MPQGLQGSQEDMLRVFAAIYKNCEDFRNYVDNFFGGAMDTTSPDSVVFYRISVVSTEFGKNVTEFR